MLCAVSHATGGLSFKPNDLKQGLSFIENSAFYNPNILKIKANPLIPKDRKTIPSRLKIKQITKSLMDNAKENAIFDTKFEIKLQAMAQARLSILFQTLQYYVKSYSPSLRVRRILKELRLLTEITDIHFEDNEYFDPDLKIFHYQGNLDRLKVFIKGPDQTPYADKWWYLWVEIPEAYPIQPPSFRFISVPYHINITSDGLICHNIL